MNIYDVLHVHPLAIHHFCQFPVVPNKKTLKKKQPSLAGHFVGFFRSPESQLASAFNHFVASAFPGVETPRGT